MDVPGKLQVSLWLQLHYVDFHTTARKLVSSVCLLNLFLYCTLQVEEVYNFSQDDLLTEDILILDTHTEVFVWIGQCVDPKEKQKAFEIAQVNMLNKLEPSLPLFPFTWCTWCIIEIFSQKYIDKAASLEGLSPHVPLYKVTEGNEPCFFTTYFSWDHAKAMVRANTLRNSNFCFPVFLKKMFILTLFNHCGR